MTSSRPAIPRPTRVIFVASRDAAPPPGDGVLIIVIDTAWTPTQGERLDVLPLRPFVARIVEKVDLFEEALDRLDRWAAESDVLERTTLDGLSLWHGIREQAWRWLHERLLWAYVLEGIAEDHHVIDFRCDPAQVALREVLAARRDSTADGSTITDGPAETTSSVAHPVASWIDHRAMAGLARRARRLARLVRPSRRGSVASDADGLEARIRAASALGDRGVLVLSYVRVAQTVGSADAGRSVDPHLAAVVDRLDAVGMVPIVLALGLDRHDPAARTVVAADDRLLPGWLLASRWGSGGPDPGAESAAVQAVDERLKAATDASVLVAGANLGMALLAEVRRLASVSASTHRRLGPRVEALLAELRPAALLMTHEGLRATWLVAASRREIPTFAVQHGIIYPTHPGYRHQRRDGVVRATVTFVYGPFERRTLLETGGYEPDEVIVSGSPRMDLDRVTRGEQDPDDRSVEVDRRRVRLELGVADGDRLLVVSTLFDRFVRWSHFTHMLDRLLGGPLPGVHVVFKQHPGETDEGPYPALLEGLAAAGGYDPPPMSVIRDIDLYRLLRAADAHLGMHSTVLTEAVVVGTPNLIATVDAHADILDYVLAGVARPVAHVNEVLAALDDPWRPDPVARQAFLDDHFRPGDASARIAATIAAERAARP